MSKARQYTSQVVDFSNQIDYIFANLDLASRKTARVQELLNNCNLIIQILKTLFGQTDLMGINLLEGTQIYTNVPQ